MFDRKTNLVLGVFVMAVAALFVMSFANSASAAPFTYSGKIVAIDNAAKTLTVQYGLNDWKIFSLNDVATVTKCNMSESFSNLKIGDEVTVRYFQASYGDFVADDITLMAPMGQHC